MKIFSLVMIACLALPTIAAQDQVNPHSNLTIASSVEQFEINKTAEVNVTIYLELGFLQCQESFQIPITVQSVHFGQLAVEPVTVNLEYQRVVLGVNYPYNYRTSETVPVQFSGNLRGAETLTLTASYDGTVPSECVTTGAMPAAEASIELTAYPPAEQPMPEAELGTTSISSDNSSSNRGTPGLGVSALLCVMLLTSIVRRQRF